jgi:hypothetical protein
MTRLTSAGKKRMKRAEKTGLLSTIRLSESQRGVIEEISARESITFSEVIRRMIDDQIRRYHVN